MKSPLSIAALAGVVLACSAAQADTGKLLLTGGVSTIAGSAGGGLTPWAVIGSNATEGEVGVSAYATRAATQDYSLNGYGVALGLHDRVELSLARQDFDASPAIALNGIAPFGVTPGQHIKMDVLGIKLKVAGDAVLDSDRWMPQIAVGLEHKRVRPGSLGSVLDFLGARTSSSLVALTYTSVPLVLVPRKSSTDPMEPGCTCLCSSPTAICGIQLSLLSTASPATLSLMPSTSILMCWPGVTPNGAMPLSAMAGDASKSCRASDSSTRSCRPRATPYPFRL